MSHRPAPNPDASEPAAPVGKIDLAEIRYSLPELLAELQLERAASSFAQEKLHQVEIGKLFKNRKKRRGKTSS